MIYETLTVCWMFCKVYFNFVLFFLFFWYNEWHRWNGVDHIHKLYKCCLSIYGFGSSDFTIIDSSFSVSFLFFAKFVKFTSSWQIIIKKLNLHPQRIGKDFVYKLFCLWLLWMTRNDLCIKWFIRKIPFCLKDEWMHEFKVCCRL